MQPRVTIFRERDRHGRDRWRVTITEILDGKRVRTAQTSRCETEARKLYREARAALEGRRLLSVGELRERWLDDVARRVKPATLASYTKLSAGLLELDAVVLELTPELAVAWYRAYQEGRAVATHRQALTVVKLLWSWALDEGIVKDDPWRKVRPEGTPSRRKAQLRAGEARKLLEHCMTLIQTSHRDYDRHGALAALIGLLFALRPSEILGLRARDVDGDRLWIDDGKTTNAARCLEVPEMLVGVLATRAAEAGEGRLFPFGKSWLGHRLEQLCQGAAVPRVTPHGLRGTHATLAAAAGATSHLVAAQLGHGATAVTERHYIEPGTTSAQKQGAVLVALQGGKR